MMPLELLSSGEQGVIMEIRHCGGCGGNCHADHSKGKIKGQTRAEELGLRIGMRIKMLKNEGNLLLLMVDEARIAIDRSMARGINMRGVTA